MAKDNPKLAQLAADRKRIEQEIAALASTSPEWPSIKWVQGYTSVDEFGILKIADQTQGTLIRMNTVDAVNLAAFIDEWLG